MDPKGYYRALGVARTADIEAIKAAYRRKAMELHPDRNRGVNATAQFQKLNEAHNVLGDPRRRREYDEESSRPMAAPEPARPRPATPAAPAGERGIEPVPCIRCGAISAQPRFTIFYEVKSFLLFTRRSRVQGVFCRGCATRQCGRSTALTWLLGWWGVPWGPIFSIHALFKNLLGGTQPLIPNGWLNAKQAWALAQRHQIDLAHMVALEALRLADKITPARKLVRLRKRYGPGYVDEGEQIRRHMNDLLRLMGRSADRGLRLRNAWGVFSGLFVAQGFVILAACVVIAAAIANLPLPSFTHTPPRGPKPYSAAGQDGAGLAAPAVTRPAAEPPSKAAYVRPRTAPNGAAWPAKPAYVSGYSVDNNTGNSRLTVDNGQNSAPVFVKLVTLDGTQARPVRIFYIPGRQRFTMNQIAPGNYDIRYRDLDTGALARSGPFLMEERRTAKGIEYSSMEMTLYRVRNGNMQTFELAEDEF